MDYRVYTVTNESILESGDPSAWSYSSRSQINPETNLPYMDEDLYMHSRFAQKAIIYRRFSCPYRVNFNCSFPQISK